MRNTAKMPRSTGSSTPPKGGGKRSRSPSPSQDGGRKKASTSVPRNALVAIRAFFAGNFELLMLLQFLLDTLTNFTLHNYKAPRMNLPEGQPTAEVVVKWLLTHMLRKPAPGEAVVTDQDWHRVLQFLRENAKLVELKPLFDFIKKYQKELELRKIIPNWVLVVLAPICESDAQSLSLLLSQDFPPRPDFWQNAIRGLTPALLPFWFTEQTCYIWQHLLFHLLQQPLSEEIKRIVQAFFADKPFEFFMQIPIDLFVLLRHNEVVTQNDVLKYLFSPNRRNMPSFINFFLDASCSLRMQIVQDFLKIHFPTIFMYISRSHQENVQSEDEFIKIFIYPHVFFKKLLEKEDGLVMSHIRELEMAKFLSLFCWNTGIFFPSCMDTSWFVSQIMKLPLPWQSLFVRLWRCELRRFGEFHVSDFITHFCHLKKCFFSENLASMMEVYMTEIVANATDDAKKSFFKWLLEQTPSIQAHFPPTIDDIQFCLSKVPVVQKKKPLFWWLFTVHSIKIDQHSNRDLTVKMTDVCEEFRLQVTVEELGLRAQNGMDPTWVVARCLNVITLNFQFGSVNVMLNFFSVYERDSFVIDGGDFFRGFVHRLQRALGNHINPKGVPNCNDLLCLILTCEARSGFFKEMSANDRAFLINLFRKHLPPLSLSDDLVKQLYCLSKLMPDEVKQAMFQNCAHIKILHEETLEHTSGRKISRDPTDPLSYEAKCSRCAHYFPLQGLGLDGHGGAICRICSQANRTPISTTLGRLPFGSL
jgi:hypothetical protein